jgi:hypothetical protein
MKDLHVNAWRVTLATLSQEEDAPPMCAAPGILAKLHRSASLEGARNAARVWSVV